MEIFHSKFKLFIYEPAKLVPSADFSLAWQRDGKRSASKPPEWKKLIWKYCEIESHLTWKIENIRSSHVVKVKPDYGSSYARGREKWFAIQVFFRWGTSAYPYVGRLEWKLNRCSNDERMGRVGEGWMESLIAFYLSKEEGGNGAM